MAMMQASTGRSFVCSVMRAARQAPCRTPSPTPAPTVSMAMEKPPVARMSASTLRTTRKRSPVSFGSLRVATTVPTTSPSCTRSPGLLACGRGAADRQLLVELRMRARDDVHGYQLADLVGGGSAGFDRGLDRRDVAAHHRGHEAAAGFLVAHQPDIGGLDHRVARLDQGDEAARLDQPESLRTVHNVPTPLAFAPRKSSPTGSDAGLLQACAELITGGCGGVNAADGRLAAHTAKIAPRSAACRDERLRTPWMQHRPTSPGRSRSDLPTD